MNEFGTVLRELRQSRGLSLRALAELIGISHVYLGEIERGKRPPPRQRVDGLINALHEAGALWDELRPLHDLGERCPKCGQAPVNLGPAARRVLGVP